MCKRKITIRMPKKILNKWLKALRSGEYTQAKGTLHDPETGGFCCLGVLQHCVDGGVEYHKHKSFCMPSRAWLEDAGIIFQDEVTANINNVPMEDMVSTCLSPYLPSLQRMADTANDNGKSFKKIADAIEKCAEGY